jgi:hypothetical protein
LHAEFVRRVDKLEEAAEAGYVTLDEVERTIGREVTPEVAQALLLLDYRTRADGTSVTLCRLNRRHPLVQRLMAW